ncbi:MAG: hypothetical protein EBZ50_03850 [Alphaproteobacteria bacterium]|nr:hypothetical protein [Alphaproteobacteria bacterium]
MTTPTEVAALIAAAKAFRVLRVDPRELEDAAALIARLAAALEAASAREARLREAVAPLAEKVIRSAVEGEAMAISFDETDAGIILNMAHRARAALGDTND